MTDNENEPIKHTLGCDGLNANHPCGVRMHPLEAQYAKKTPDKQALEISFCVQHIGTRQMRNDFKVDGDSNATINKCCIETNVGLDKLAGITTNNNSNKDNNNKRAQIVTVTLGSRRIHSVYFFQTTIALQLHW